MHVPVHTYQLLALRNQQTPFEVRALSPDDACRIIRRSLSRIAEHGQDQGLADIRMHEVEPVWLVMRTTPYEYCRFLHVEAWDGQHFKSFARVEIGLDILSALRDAAGLPMPRACASR